MQQDVSTTPDIKALLAAHDDAALRALMANPAGYALAAILALFASVDSDRPHCFVAYSIKSRGLPLAGHKDNHSGMMNFAKRAAFKQAEGIADSVEWEPLARVRLLPRARAKLSGADSIFFGQQLTARSANCCSAANAGLPTRPSPLYVSGVGAHGL
ncbi:MAG: hypothetical protein O3B24_09285 [Verrucomicrobia bacterium]|nr:hypothetical protein [Verrucomicrobiota bacterium]